MSDENASVRMPWSHFCPIHLRVWSAYGRWGYLARCWDCDRAGRWTCAEIDPED